MAYFFVRVQLFQRSNEHPDYVRLHAEMLADGYSSMLRRSSDGIALDLPHAMYVIEGPFTASYVRDDVERIVDAIWTKNAILVMETRTWRSRGLRRTSLGTRLKHLLRRPYRS